jgi:cytidyltransferase-like protein
MIITFSDLPKLRAKHKNKRIVLGGGVFDLVHVGHLEYIKSLRQYGDIVVLMVKSDERIRKYKGPGRPIICEADRVCMVAALSGVDYAFIGPNIPQTPTSIDASHEAVLASLQPDVFCSTNPVWERLEGLGTTKVIIGHRPADSTSTTKIIQRVLDLAPGKIKHAKARKTR